MPTIPLIVIKQRTEDGVIAIDTQIQNPLMVADLLLTAAKTYIGQAGSTMELKKEAALITGENGKAILT